ncbi:MAG: valine--tRNA ligase [Rickettsiaceae bacterium]|nr:valine--tRNA ligase [Rickettsiaceae bacterium]
MSQLDSYNFRDREHNWRKFWREKKIYAFNPNLDRSSNYSIDTPPPTVSGQLHMGHIFSYSQADFIARFQRMQGKNVFYPIGFDDNGLPTERLVEKVKNIKAPSMMRQEFIDNCKEVIEAEEEKFADLFDSIGFSFDWDLKYQTITATSVAVSQLSFLDLVEKRQIYRAEQPVLWDPVDQTALAQADIEDKEQNSEMHDISFRSSKGDELIIATTRPELLPACVCLLYHPDDERYKHLEGDYAISPIFGVRVKILADDLVKQDKGTGLVMCCTFGDTTDLLWRSKHNLPFKIIINKQGRIEDSLKFESEEANKSFKSLVGLKVKEARVKILELLRNSYDLKKSIPIIQNVKCAERSGAPLEIITTNQWFVKAVDHKDDLLKKSEELNWYPQQMKIKLDSWINSVSWDWCISRQRYFGVPFPVWYSLKKGEEGRVIFADKNRLPVDPLVDLPEGYSIDEVVADKDVMDTWATSAVSPQLCTHFINEKYNLHSRLHDSLYPFDLRPQAHEILRSWAFYTMLKSHLHQNTLPWKNIMISGWCLAHDKTKMSKSKGNIISPVELIENFGADVVRYWASCSRLGQDTSFSEDLLKLGKKLVNKLWNASKFASSHFAKIKGTNLTFEQAIKNKIIFYDIDLWLIAKMHNTIEQSTIAYEALEYRQAMEHIEYFFWHDFCDNYLEISKARCYHEDGINQEGKLSAIYTLYLVLENILALFAPILPFITEEIYSKLYGDGSIHSGGKWPKVVFSEAEKLLEAEKAGDSMVLVLELVRKAKSEKNLSIKAQIKELSICFVGNFSENSIQDLKFVTNSEKITLLNLMSKQGDKIFDQVIDDGQDSVIGIKYPDS